MKSKSRRWWSSFFLIYILQTTWGLCSPSQARYYIPNYGKQQSHSEKSPPKFMRTYFVCHIDDDFLNKTKQNWQQIEECLDVTSPSPCLSEVQHCVKWVTHQFCPSKCPLTKTVTLTVPVNEALGYRPTSWKKCNVLDIFTLAKNILLSHHPVIKQTDP